MKTLAYPVIAVLLISAHPRLSGQSSDAKTALHEALNNQFALTKVSNNRNDIVTAGAVLVLQKDGLMMYSVASPMPPLNTYKNGKLSQGMGGFGRDLAITLAAPGNSTSANYPQRKFVSGEKFWVAGFGIQKDGIVFELYSDPLDDVRYYGQLKFPFDKRAIPSPDVALAKIAEVLTIQPPEPVDGAASKGPQGGEPAQAVPTKGVLQNEDILKMAKAGLDDSIIIAKIKSSSCQFDTAPDTLIGLKQSGISSAVLRAMAEASNQH